MTTQRVPLAKLGATLRKDLGTLQGKLVGATWRAAREGVKIARRNAPKAFLELADGIADVPLDRSALVVSTAPHSDAVENGSRPHMPPVEPIAEWVRLRGMQGLTSAGRVTKRAGAPQAIAKMIRAAQTKRSVAVDVPLEIAWAIAMKIKQRGTAPTWFMYRSLPEIERALDKFIQRALGS